MRFLEPREAVLQMGLREGMKVADFGSGTGHYALAASSLVGEEGRVYAVDVQEDVLRALSRDAATRGIKNLETVWGDLEKPGGTKLRDGVIDAAILANILFQLSDKKAVLVEVRRVLKPGGKVLLIDWNSDYGGLGPLPEHVITEKDADHLLRDAGFYEIKRFPAGPHHYGLVYQAP